MGICQQAFGHVGLMGKASGQEDTSCLALDTYPLVSGRVALMGKVSVLVGTSSQGRDTYLQAFGHAAWMAKAFVPEAMMDPLAGHLLLVFRLPLLGPYRKLL